MIPVTGVADTTEITGRVLYNFVQKEEKLHLKSRNEPKE
jgi:hypothetical protein